MTKCATPILSAFLVVLLLFAAAAEPATADEIPGPTAARAETPRDARLVARGGSELPGKRIFYMTAHARAKFVRAVPDVTGDGLPEVLVGIGDFDVSADNLFLLDGASTGAATVLWSLETGGVSDSIPTALTVISDTDGNGYPNILVGTHREGLTAYNLDALDGSIQWQLEVSELGAMTSLVELSDVTGDGVPEVAIGLNWTNNSVYMVDGASTGAATVLWRYYAGDDVNALCNAGDLDGDGDDDLFAATGGFEDIPQMVALSGGTIFPIGQVIWQHASVADFEKCGVLPDVTGDGKAEALVSLNRYDAPIRSLDGATGGELWSSTSVDGLGRKLEVLADVTGDGIPEVLVSSSEDALSVLDGADGSEVWKNVIPGTPGLNVISDVRAIGDLDDDGHEDVIAGSPNDLVYAFSGVDGETIWVYNARNRVLSVAPLDDLDGDGIPDVAVGTRDLTNDVVVHVLTGNPPLILFIDGFESGDTNAWSLTLP
jgi:hypothetical protein